MTGHDDPYFIVVAAEICSKCQRDSHRLSPPPSAHGPFLYYLHQTRMMMVIIIKKTGIRVKNFLRSFYPIYLRTKEKKDSSPSKNRLSRGICVFTQVR